MKSKASGHETQKDKTQGEGFSTTVSGIVIPVDWDDQGKALATAILGPREEEYFVEAAGDTDELLNYLQKHVEVSGSVREVTSGRKFIKVTSVDLKTDAEW